MLGLSPSSLCPALVCVIMTFAWPVLHNPWTFVWPCYPLPYSACYSSLPHPDLYHTIACSHHVELNPGHVLCCPGLVPCLVLQIHCPGLDLSVVSLVLDMTFPVHPDFGSKQSYLNKLACFMLWGYDALRLTKNNDQQNGVFCHMHHNESDFCALHALTWWLKHTFIFSCTQTYGLMIVFNWGFVSSRVGRGWQKLLFATGFNRF